MSRWEFMRRLEELLSDISPNEREEALQYYNDYFNDAGRENEASVIEALGSPEQVAAIVKEGLGDGVSQGEFTEHGFQSAGSEETKNEVINNTDSRTEDAHQTEGGYDKAREKSGAGKKKEMPAWAIVLIVIACFIGSPVILGAAGGLAGILFGIVVAVLALVFGLGLTALILFVVAVSLFVAGIGALIYSPIDAIGLIGGAFICGAIGILAMLATVWITGRGLPAICRGIGYCFNRIFGKKGERS